MTSLKSTPCFPRHGPLGAAGPEAAASLASIMVRLCRFVLSECFLVWKCVLCEGIIRSEMNLSDSWWNTKTLKGGDYDL